MLESKFRPEFTAEYGDLMFVNAEIARKCFTPEIIPEMQQENDLVQAYEKLLASAQIPFEGKTYTLSQLTPLKSDPDDARRLAAWQADAKWSMEHAAELDEHSSECGETKFPHILQAFNAFFDGCIRRWTWRLYGRRPWPG